MNSMAVISVQFSQIVAVDLHTLLHGDEGMGVDLVNGLTQILQLKLGGADAEHVQGIAGISALAVPAGAAAAQLLRQAVRHFGIAGLGEDQHLQVDVLLMEAIYHQTECGGIDDGIDHGIEGEQEEAADVQQHIGGHAETAHSDPADLLGQRQSHDVYAAERTAAGQSDAKACAADQCAQQGAGQGVGQQRLCGDGDEQRNAGINREEQHRADHEISAESFECQIENGDVQGIVDNVGNIHLKAGAEGIFHQSAGHLSITQQTCGVEIQRNDQSVHAKSKDHCAETAGQHPISGAMERIVQQKDPSPKKNIYFIGSFYYRTAFDKVKQSGQKAYCRQWRSRFSARAMVRETVEGKTPNSRAICCMVLPSSK